MRDKIGQEFANQAGQYDVATLSNFEIPIYADSKWLAPLDGYIAEDPAFDQADIFPPMTEVAVGEDGKVYGEPFYGESSFLMYRKDMLRRQGHHDAGQPDLAAGRRHRREGRRRPARDEGHLPARPARLGPGLRAADHGGQHLRRHLVRPRTGTRRSTRPEFKEATKFYVDLVRSTVRTARRRPVSPSA